MAIPKGYQRLENSKRHIRPNAKRVRAADANQIISVTITVRRRAGAPPLPEQEHWEASPPGKRSYLSTEDFAAHYGADPEDLDAVAKFAVDHGLKVIEKNIAQRIVI